VRSHVTPGLIDARQRNGPLFPPFGPREADLEHPWGVLVPVGVHSNLSIGFKQNYKTQSPIKNEVQHLAEIK
jgi:hypothetical protein